jgi:hypothetical protein
LVSKGAKPGDSALIESADRGKIPARHGSRHLQNLGTKEWRKELPKIVNIQLNPSETLELMESPNHVPERD